jgi:predicted heme/steroid binding protein
MTKQHKFNLISAVVAFALVGGAVYVRSSSAKPKEESQTQAASTAERKPELKKLTPQELAANDGKDDHKCYVAVDKKVYEIEQGRLWKDGEHTTSNGQAHCGLDLTEAIGKSPHGKSKLEALSVVGTLE